jgi:hypothetical protein
MDRKTDYPKCSLKRNVKLKHSPAFLVIAMAMALTMAGPLLAQPPDTVYVEPDDHPNEIGALNQAIEEHGGGVIYVLQNGATYFLDYPGLSYEHPLRIHADEYPGDNPPIIRVGSTPLGGTPGLARFQDDVEIVGVFLYALVDLGYAEYNMEFYKEGGRAVFRHCYVSAGAIGMFRIHTDNMTLRIEDCQMRDPGRHPHPASHRFIDMRGHDMDSIIVINSSLYQIASDIVRTGGGAVDYLEFNHVTIANHLRNPLDLGRARKAIIRNSLFVNTGADGVWESKELAGQAGHAYNGQRYFDTGGLIRVASYEDHPDKVDGSDEQRRIVIRNNNFGGMPDSMFIDLWQKMSEDDPERDFGRGAGHRPWATDPQWLWENPYVRPDDQQWAERDTIPLIRIRTAPMDSLLRAWAKEEVPWVHIAKNLEEQVSFADPPEYWRMADYGYARWFTGSFPRHFDRWDSIVADPGNRFYHPGPGTPSNPTGPTAAWWRDLSYSTGSASYTAAENGFPAGNLNYFPELRKQWAYQSPTSIEQEPAPQQPSGIALLANYPNPFNPVTQIPFELPGQSRVHLAVYDVLGRQVAVLADRVYASGRHEVSLDASGLSSGVYVVRMTATPEQGHPRRFSRQIMLVK